MSQYFTFYMLKNTGHISGAVISVEFLYALTHAKAE